MKTWKVEAAIIAVGMVLLGVIIKWGINDFIDKERIVSVKGLAEMEVPADKVIWPLMYKDIGNDPSLLYANMEQKKRLFTITFMKLPIFCKTVRIPLQPWPLQVQISRHSGAS